MKLCSQNVWYLHDRSLFILDVSKMGRGARDANKGLGDQVTKEIYSTLTLIEIQLAIKYTLILICP